MFSVIFSIKIASGSMFFICLHFESQSFKIGSRFDLSVSGNSLKLFCKFFIVLVGYGNPPIVIIKPNLHSQRGIKDDQ